MPGWCRIERPPGCTDAARQRPATRGAGIQSPLERRRRPQRASCQDRTGPTNVYPSCAPSVAPRPGISVARTTDQRLVVRSHNKTLLRATNPNTKALNPRRLHAPWGVQWRTPLEIAWGRPPIYLGLASRRSRGLQRARAAPWRARPCHRQACEGRRPWEKD